MISRDEYLNVLKRFKDKALIKVITGIRRCGKSTLLEMFQDYLKENGVEESQIISINLEDLEYNFITDYMTLYKYINDKLPDSIYERCCNFSLLEIKCNEYNNSLIKN